ncbi:MAG: hypothetical protein WAN02_32950, partial [Mycobacterium sp.]
MLAVELVVGAFTVIGQRPAAQRSGQPSVGLSAPRRLEIGDRSLVMTNLDGPQSQTLLARVAADMGHAIDAVEAFWGTDWPHDVDVVATGSQQQFEARAGGGPAGQWADIAAIAVADRVEPARRIALGQRIVFAPGAARMSESALRIVLS